MIECQLATLPPASAGPPCPPPLTHPLCLWWTAPCCIAENHSQASVIVDATGAQMRYCQQCAVMHPLVSFQGERRSCIASLSKRCKRHPARKRKTARGGARQPGSEAEGGDEPAAGGDGSDAEGGAAAGAARSNDRGAGGSGSGMKGEAEHSANPSVAATPSAERHSDEGELSTPGSTSRGVPTGQGMVKRHASEEMWLGQPRCSAVGASSPLQPPPQLPPQQHQDQRRLFRSLHLPLLPHQLQFESLVSLQLRQQQQQPEQEPHQGGPSVADPIGGSGLSAAELGELLVVDTGGQGLGSDVCWLVGKRRSHSFICIPACPADMLAVTMQAPAAASGSGSRGPSRAAAATSSTTCVGTSTSAGVTMQAAAGADTMAPPPLSSSSGGALPSPSSALSLERGRSASLPMPASPASAPCLPTSADDADADGSAASSAADWAVHPAAMLVASLEGRAATLLPGAVQDSAIDQLVARFALKVSDCLERSDGAMVEAGGRAAARSPAHQLARGTVSRPFTAPLSSVSSSSHCSGAGSLQRTYPSRFGPRSCQQCRVRERVTDCLLCQTACCPLPRPPPPSRRHFSPAVTPTVLMGAVRAGCTHLILDVMLTQAELQQLASPERVAAAVQHLRRPACWPGRAAPPDCLVSCCCWRVTGTSAVLLVKE